MKKKDNFYFSKVGSLLAVRKNSVLRKAYENLFNRSPQVIFRDQHVAGYEMRERGTLENFFSSLDLGKIENLCFELRSEIDDFCRDHPNKLARNRRYTFFLCKEGGSITVIRICVNDYSELIIDEFPINYGLEWSPLHWVVVVLPPEKK
ncbi:MAG: hypothetical protein WC671_00555 [Candidatus Paceibacterota bacterium]|jgi:hypothetical protein